MTRSVVGEPGVNEALLHDARHGRWLLFRSPRSVMTARRRHEVNDVLSAVENDTRKRGAWAAGFIAYEAAPAFDPALSVRPDGEFPLVWFGLYDAPAEVKLPPPPARTTRLSWRPSVTPREYGRAIRRIRAYIRAGDTYQVNYTFRLRASGLHDPWALFLRMLGEQATAYAAYLRTGRWALCSASPELFLRRENTSIESRPMKGTACRGLWPAQDRRQADFLRRSEKNRAENVMIVDMVRNDLGRVAEAGTVRVPAIFQVERYPTVWQMTSTVVARTSAPLTAVLAATFPPASITGAPKRRTMEIIAELESSPRRIYTGAIGFLAPGRRAQFSVAIRTALLDRRRGTGEYGVGGGIVWDSDAADERVECQTKARILEADPAPFELLETLLWTPRKGYRLLGRHLRRLAESASYFDFACDGAFEENSPA